MSQRINFGKIHEVAEPPNLIEIQIRSYEEFLQKNILPSKRKELGLQAVFKEVFPIESYDQKMTLDFVMYEIGEPKLTALEAIREAETYSAPLYVTFELRDEAGAKQERVYMGEIPLMTDRGAFVINGAERVVVSQLHRSPGICFESTQHLNGRWLFGFRIIPDRGTWLEVQFDTNDLLYVYLDRRRRRRKFLATTLLRVIGYPNDEDILNLFYKIEDLKLKETMKEEEISTKLLFKDILDGELIVARAYEPLTAGVARQLVQLGHKTVKVVTASQDDLIITSLRKDPARDEDEALKEIYRRLRPGDPPTIPNARALVKRLFFDPKRYDLTRVGRYKINQKLGLKTDSDMRVLDPNDVISAHDLSLQAARQRGPARRH